MLHIFNLASDPIGFSRDLCLGGSGEAPSFTLFFVSVLSLLHDTEESLGNVMMLLPVLPCRYSSDRE